MATDVIIDPTNGQIYWNDSAGVGTQSISIKGDAANTISVVGYGGFFSPGSTPSDPLVIAQFNDNLGNAALVPGTNAYELGSATYRWKLFSTTGNFSSNTLSSDLYTGAVLINGGIAISGNAAIGQSLLLYNPSGSNYTGFKAQAVSSNTIYSLPTAFPSTGTSILQSDTSGIMTWVPLSSSSGSTASNINIVNAASGTFYPLFTNTSSTANGTAGVAVSVNGNLSFDATNSLLIVDGVTLGGAGLTTTLTSFFFGTSNSTSIGQTLNFSNTTTGPVMFNFGTSSSVASTVTFFGSVNTNRLVLNTAPSNGNLYIQTNQTNARVRMFQNNLTGNVSIFGLGGGTLFLGEDTTTNNADIAIKGTVISGGGGNVRAALFTISTATSNGSGVGGTIQFQTSTSGVSLGPTNALRTRLRIEGAATGTSNLDSLIILGDASSGAAWTSYIRGVDANGSNIEAGEIQIQAGRSTGSGLAQGISFYVSSSGAGAAVLNTPLQIGRFTGTGLTIYSTTVTSSTTTGALVVAGGVGIGGTLFTDPGRTSSISGFGFSNGSGTGNSIILNSSAVTTSTTTGALIVAGGVGIGGTLFTDPAKTSSISGFGFSNGVGTGTSIVLNSTAVTLSTTSGALVVAGGVGIGGTLFTDPGKRSSVSGFAISNGVGTGTSLILNSSAVTTDTTSGALIVSGGVGIGGTLFTDPSKRSSVSGFAISNGVGTGTSLILNSAAPSTNTTSGGFIISGGAGIAKSLNIGEGINLWNGANYTGLKSAASTSIQYTLPPTVPSGTGSSFLSASDTGVMAWVAAPTGGSASPGGSNRQVQFNDSTAFGGAVGMTWESSTYLLQLNSLNQTNSMALGLRLENGSSTSGFNNTRWSPALEFVGRNGITTQYRSRFTTEVVPVAPDDYRAYLRFKYSLDTGASSFNNNIFLIHSTLGVGIGASNTTSNNAIFFRAPTALSADKVYILPADLPTTGSVGSSVLSSDTSGNLIWAAMSAGSPGGSGTVNSGTAYSTAYYNADGTTVSGTGLLKIIPSGTAISSFADIDIKSGKIIRFWEATNNVYTGINAGANSQTYNLTLPTAKVGTGFSTIIVDSSGNMSFAPILSGSGVSIISSGTGVTVRNKTPLMITLAAGYTPAIGTTADDVILRLPESFEDGSSSVNWVPKRAFMRTETPFSGVTLLNIEYYSGVGTFSPTNLLSGAGISLGVSGIAETASTNFSVSSLSSGTKLRMNFSQINSQHTDFLIYVQFQEQ